MKKFLSMMIVAVLLVSSLSVSAFAATTITTEGNTSQDVYAKYAEGSKNHAYKVELKWGDMKFTYSAANESWNTGTHTWDKTGGGWSVNNKGGDEITITNHSSQSVKATMNFAPTTGLGVTGGTFSGDGVSNNEVTIGVGNSTTGAVVQTVKFVPTGTLDSSKTTETNIGKITITLN